MQAPKVGDRVRIVSSHYAPSWKGREGTVVAVTDAPGAQCPYQIEFDSRTWRYRVLSFEFEELEVIEPDALGELIAERAAADPAFPLKVTIAELRLQLARVEKERDDYKARMHKACEIARALDGRFNRAWRAVNKSDPELDELVRHMAVAHALNMLEGV